jgi:hypothetical protein
MDRFPTKTGGAYSPPPLSMMGNDVETLRSTMARELQLIAESLRGMPLISVNSIPMLWVPGVHLSLAGAVAAPVAAVRGNWPVAVYGAGAPADGYISFRTTVPGLFRLYLVYSQDAPAGGFLRWLVTTSVLGSEGGLTANQLSTAGGVAHNLSVDGPLTDRVVWKACGDMFLDAPCSVGVKVARTPGVAPDTGLTDAYVLGVSLERIGSHA